MKKWSILAVGAALVLSATLALAGPGGRGMGPGGGYGRGSGMGYSAIPDLTPDQSAQIKALQEAFLQEIEPIQEVLAAKRAELQGLWQTPNPDSAALSVKQKEMSDIRFSLQERATSHRLEVRQVLTPEQQAQLPAFGAGMGRGMGEKMGHGNRW
jgi:Spy/CpxP family protein refolding chaperone